MADLFNKHIKKATNRTKEKLLEGIGKAKATQDEVFDQHAANLSKQSKAYEKLHKDVKVYAAALKTLINAEKQLRDTIREAYEAEWPEREHLTAIFDNLDIQSNDLEKSVCEDLVQSVTSYVNQFPDLKKKVEKRGRKLVDYDSAKNSFNSIKASSKKDNDPKLAKATVELQSAESMYTEMNNELLEVLPAVYDSRITFFVDTLQTLFNSNSIYQTEASKFHKQIVMQLDTLGESMDYLRVARPEARTLTPIDTTSIGTGVAGGDDNTSIRLSTPSPSIPAALPVTPKPRESIASVANSTNPFDEEDEEKIEDVEEKIEQKVYPKLNAEQNAAAEVAIAAAKKEEKEKDSANPFDDDEEEEEIKEKEVKKSEEENDEKVQVLDDVTKEKRKTLYFVQSTYHYDAVDTDELSFPVGVRIKASAMVFNCSPCAKRHAGLTAILSIANDKSFDSKDPAAVFSSCKLRFAAFVAEPFLHPEDLHLDVYSTSIDVVNLKVHCTLPLEMRLLYTAILAYNRAENDVNKKIGFSCFGGDGLQKYGPIIIRFAPRPAPRSAHQPRSSKLSIAASASATQPASSSATLPVVPVDSSASSPSSRGSGRSRRRGRRAMRGSQRRSRSRRRSRSCTRSSSSRTRSVSSCDETFLKAVENSKRSGHKHHRRCRIASTSSSGSESRIPPKSRSALGNQTNGLVRVASSSSTGSTHSRDRIQPARPMRNTNRRDPTSRQCGSNVRDFAKSVVPSSGKKSATKTDSAEHQTLDFGNSKKSRNRQAAKIAQLFMEFFPSPPSSSSATTGF